jgi:alkanesulfonate monooxygenase SsuD/methylene tetrahydromethanopterin reductase-like flavin-dependent oxidoreductase (luciferase family)
MIVPWIFEFADVSPAPGEAVYDWYLPLWKKAEALGFEGIFFSEHHFHDHATSPSPHLLLATLAQRTSRLRLGVMGSVLPLHTPWRVAEEIGYSSGAGPAEVEMAGIPSKEVVPRFNEAIEIIERALIGEEFDHKGKFFRFNTLATRPLVYRRLPPRWMTVLSEGAAGAAAKRGFRICTGFLPVPQVREVFDAYRSVHGGPCRDRLALRRQVLIAKTRSEAADLVAAAESDVRAEFGEDADVLVPDAPRHSPFDFMFERDEKIFGTPADVTEQIVAQCRETGCGNILAFVFRTIPRDAIERSYRLWREVIPKLRMARIGERRPKPPVARARIRGRRSAG